MNSFNDWYYTFSPTIADYERENPIFKESNQDFINSNDQFSLNSKQCRHWIQKNKF